MTDQHPITPPSKLIEQWVSMLEHFTDKKVFSLAAQWGADQELEACCEWLRNQHLATHKDLIPSLRTARRPKPPSLKEEALDALEEIGQVGSALVRSRSDTIRRALEQLDD